MSTPVFAPRVDAASVPQLPPCRCGHSAKNHGGVSSRIARRVPIDPEHAHGCHLCDCGWEVRAPAGYAPDLRDAASFIAFRDYQIWARAAS